MYAAHKQLCICYLNCVLIYECFSYLYLIQEGLRQGFQLEEIQLAAKIKRGRACDFLLKEWGHYVERTAFRINQISADIHKKKNISGNIGNPQRREVVQFLIEEHGDCEKAAQKCCDSRMKKVVLHISVILS